jgi:hypothetical protein
MRPQRARVNKWSINRSLRRLVLCLWASNTSAPHVRTPASGAAHGEPSATTAGKVVLSGYWLRLHLKTLDWSGLPWLRPFITVTEDKIVVPDFDSGIRHDMMVAALWHLWPHQQWRRAQPMSGSSSVHDAIRLCRHDGEPNVVLNGESVKVGRRIIQRIIRS